MSSTPYQEGDSAPVSPSGTVSSHDSTRRRKTPPTSATLSLSFSLSEHERGGNDDSGSGMLPPMPRIEIRATMREMICNYMLGKSKVLVYGQLLAFILAATGAIQSTLHLDCRLSAPTFSMLSVFFPLSMICLGRLVWEGREQVFISRRQSASSLSELDQLSMQSNQRGGNVGGATDEASSSPPERERIRASIRARPEKRNHLLSRWSHRPPPPVAVAQDRFYVDGDNETTSVGLGTEQGASSRTKPYLLFGRLPLQSSPRDYFIIAVVDVYANYTTILAYKYTTITNVALFDALAIPTTMIMSRVFYGRRYTKVHLLGVLCCSIGIGLNLMQDYKEDKELHELSDDEETEQQQMIEKEYPHKLAGDILAIIGGVLFGVVNTLQEVSVKESSSVTEYLGCFMLFASVICFFQALILERDEIMEFVNQSASETCSKGEGPVLFILYAVVCGLGYAGIGSFLQIADACFFNLSLLTGDAWVVAFSIFAERIKPPPTFYVALLITVSGVVIYETAPSPVVDSLDEVIGEIQMTENSSTGRQRDEEEVEGALT